MTIYQLIAEQPTLEQLASRYPHLRRYLAHGFQTDIRYHDNDAIGLINNRQILCVDLVSADVHVVA